MFPYRLFNKASILLWMFFIVTFSAVHAEALTPQQILTNADDHRGIQNKAFSMKIRILSTIAGETREQLELTAYIDNESDPDNWNTLVRTTAPSQRKGQLMLLEGNRMWFYKPGTRRPVRISPAQRLLGGASTGDVASFNFREYYTINSMEEVKIGKTEAYLFTLEKKPDTAASYEKVKLWVQKKSFFPIQAEFFAKSGRKLKTCYYGGFKTILGLKRVTEMVIVDAIRKDNITRMYIDSMEIESLPKNYYRSDQLTSIGF